MSAHYPISYTPVSVLYQDAIVRKNWASFVSEENAAHLDSPHTIQTHFPATSTTRGNTMICLEDALLSIFNLANLVGAEREHQLNELRQKVIYCNGSLLKTSDNLNAPIVCDTYTTSEGKLYYMFLVTWKIRLAQHGGPDILISRLQWVVPYVQQPMHFSNTREVLYSHHLALLTVKAHIFIIKNGFDKTQRQYGRVLRCINFVRENNCLGRQTLTFTTDILDVDCKKDPDSSYVLDNTISASQTATALCVALKNAQGKRVCVYIDQAFTGRRLNDARNGYDKVRCGDSIYDPATGITPLCIKRQQQAHGMIVRGNKQFSEHIRALHAEPDELDTILNNSFPGRNERGLTFRELNAERYAARAICLASAQEAVKQTHKELVSSITRVYKQHERGLGNSLSVSFGMKFNKSDYMRKMLQALGTKTLRTDQRDEIARVLTNFRQAVASLKTENMCVYRLARACGKRGTAAQNSDYIKYDDLIALVDSIS